MFGQLDSISKIVVTFVVGGGLVSLAVLGERVLYRVSKRYRYFIKTGK